MSVYQIVFSPTMKAINERILQEEEENIRKDYDDSIRQQVEMVVSLLDSYKAGIDAGVYYYDENKILREYTGAEITITSGDTKTPYSVGDEINCSTNVYTLFASKSESAHSLILPSGDVTATLTPESGLDTVKLSP
mgnify:CR=1 FL=1